jgi:hypothetical protein
MLSQQTNSFWDAPYDEWKQGSKDEREKEHIHAITRIFV